MKRCNAIGAACLAAGLVGGWACEADASVVFQGQQVNLSVNPTTPNGLTHAFAITNYNLNTSGSGSSITGPLSFPPPNQSFIDGGRFQSGYTGGGLVGLYTSGGVAVAFSTTQDAGALGQTFDSYFGISEATVASDLAANNQNGSGLSALLNYIEFHAATSPALNTPMTLVDFSTGAAGGTAIFSAGPAPEPAGALVMTAIGGLSPAVRRRRV